MSALKIVALSGGVGGARFLRGLVGMGEVTAIVNTGDDFEHWGLHIAPDLDTVMYTLAGLSPEERGWGIADETFATLEMVKRYGGPGWFMLGDRDIATHLLRSDALRKGERLTDVTNRLASALGVSTRILPMADGACRTMIETEEHGSLSFQDWFVLHRTGPRAERVRFEGDPPATPEVLAAIEEADVVLMGPSNPYVSIDPILTRAGVTEALVKKTVVAVSPIVGGEAVKGPLAAMIPVLAGRQASAQAVAAHYGSLLSGFVVERGDEGGVSGLPVLATRTVMKDREQSARLCREALEFALSLARAKSSQK